MLRLQRMLIAAAGLAGASAALAPPAAARQSAPARPATSASTGPSAAQAAAPAPGPAASPAPAVALAEHHAEEAFQAYERKDYARAVALYHEALRAAPSADIVYNLARVYDAGLHDRELAMRFYARYLEEPAAVESRAERARERLEALRAEAAAAPLAAPVTSPPEAAAAAPAPARRPAEPAGSALPAVAVAAGALGLVGVGVGVGYGITAKSRLDVSQRYCDDNACTTQRGVEAARSAARAADVATVGFVAGGALLALGTALWLLADAEEEEAQRRGPGELEWTPSLAPGAVSLAVSGSFSGP